MEKIKRSLCLALCVALLLSLGLPVRARAEGERLESAQAVLALLTEGRETGEDPLEFTCAPAFFEELSADSFALLEKLQLQAGIVDSRVRYSGSQYLVQISRPEYGEVLWSECADEQEVRGAVLSYLEQGAEGFVLFCPTALCRQLADNGHLYAYLAQGGVFGGSSIRIRPEMGTIRVEKLDYNAPLPYAVVEDYAQFAAAMAAFAAQGITEFNVVLDPELFARVTGDKAEMTTMVGGSMLSRYGAVSNGRSRVMKFYSVEFTDVPRSICRAEEDVTAAIRQMGAAGVTEFELIFPYKELFDTLSADSYARLNALEAEAGMSGGRLSYSLSGDRIHFSEAEITAEPVAKLTSLEETIAFVDAQVAAGASDIALFCTEELYGTLLGELLTFTLLPSGMDPIYDLISQAGIADFALSYSTPTHAISIHVEKLFPGTAIALAAASGDDSALSERERETWAVAGQIAADARSEEPLETARYIHDWLCAHCVYTIDETTDEDDTAIGAILNGEANCDGYTDAFYLIGTLAGLTVRYQHGDSYSKGLFVGFGKPVTHIWNLLELDGSWRMVDVTWDDEEEGWSYTWFNVGQDLAGRMHIWNEAMTVPLAATTERDALAVNPFFVADAAQLEEAARTARAQGMSSVHILFADLADAETLCQRALDAFSDAAAGSFRYSWSERMGLLSLYGLRW